MILPVTLAWSLLFWAIALTRPKIAFYVFVFLLPFLPRYLGIGVGDEGLALTQRRIMAWFLFSGFTAYLLLLPNTLLRLKGILSQTLIHPIFVVIILIYAVKLISTVLNSGLFKTVYVLDEILLTVMFFLMAVAFINTERDVRLLLFFIVLGLLVSELISALDHFKGSPLLQGIVSVDVEVARDPTLGRERYDTYRSQAMFDNPLLLSQFICIAWPFAWFMRKDADLRVRVMAWFSLVLAPFTLFFVLSRSGFLVAALSLLLYGSYVLYRQGKRSLRIAVALILVVLLGSISIFSLNVFMHPESYFHQGGGSADSSALERISQYVVVFEALHQSPIIGWGMTQNFGNDLDFLNGLDNYWLRLLLEGGLVLVFLYLLLFFRILKICLAFIKNGQSVRDESFLLAITTTIIAIALYMLFVSIPTNNVYLFLISGLLIKHVFMSKHRFANTKKASFACEACQEIK